MHSGDALFLKRRIINGMPRSPHGGNIRLELMQAGSGIGFEHWQKLFDIGVHMASLKVLASGECTESSRTPRHRLR